MNVYLTVTTIVCAGVLGQESTRGEQRLRAKI